MKKISLAYIAIICLVLLISSIFHQWFLGKVIAGGDLGYYYFSNYKDYMLYPYAWNWQLQNGLGGFTAPIAWILYDITIPIVFGKLFHIDWQILLQIFYLIPFLLISVLSSWYLLRKIFPDNKFSFLAALIYVTNTYILMMVGGGQIVGISHAYAIFPFVTATFITLLRRDTYSLKKGISAGLIFALLVLFDLRFAYMFILAVCLLFIMQLSIHWKKSLLNFFLPFLITVLLHAFWILPILITHQNPTQNIGDAYTSLDSVSFFSFAKFENTIALLHPYWPENIFGKVAFMNPVFLFLPLLAFLSLLLIEKKKSEETKYVLYFALLGLIGAFLAKGSNDPFGGIYIWLFQHIPGFVMFRDSSKWYTFVALSYSVLIPFSLWKVYRFIQMHQEIILFRYKIPIILKRYHIEKFVPLFFLVYLVFILFPAFSNQLRGTFAEHTVPSSYQQFAQQMQTNPTFFRTVWFPTTQHYAYSSATHPAISAQNFLNSYDPKKLEHVFMQQKTKQLLEEASVKYVILPDDSEKEIFLRDRLYSQKVYDQTYTFLRTIPWLHEVDVNGTLKVFAMDQYKEYVWSPNGNLQVSSSEVSPVQKEMQIRNAKKDDRVVIAAAFDSQWYASLQNGLRIEPQLYDGTYLSFVLPQNGNYQLDIRYGPQQWMNIGLLITVITFIISVAVLLVKQK